MGEWKEYRLGDLIEYKKGFAFKSSTYQTEGTPVVRVSDTTANSINISTCHRVNSDIALRCKPYELKEGDVVIATVGSWADNPNSIVGKVIRVPKEADGALLNQNAVRIRSNGTIDNKMLYYRLKDKSFSDYLLNTAQGSANQASITLNDIFAYSVLLPPLEKQKEIAEILSSIDAKIDLLNNQNATLESMAETLFRHHFIDNAQADWVDGFLGDYIIETVGGEWGKENTQGEFTKVVQCIRGTDVADLNVGISTKAPIRYVKDKKFQSIEPQEGDIIIEISGGTENQSTGRCTYINVDVKQLFSLPLVFSNFCRLLRIKKKEFSFFLYEYISYLYNQDEFFNLENGSSGIKNLDYKSLLYGLKFKLPTDENQIINYHSEVETYFKKINTNKMQILTLTKLRDTLLPRLMSNEIKI